MFNVDGKEFITLVLVALVVLGPEKLPDVFRRVGRVYSEVRRMSDSFQAEFQRAIEEPIKQVDETRDLVRESLDFRPTESTSTNGTDAEPATEPGTGPVDGGDHDEPEEPGPDAVDDDRVEVDKDQAEVERRIAEMEQIAAIADDAEEGDE